MTHKGPPKRTPPMSPKALFQKDSRHVHEPVPHPPYVEYVPVQRQRFYTCATCGCALFVIPTPEEADEYDRVLEAQVEERG